MHSKTKNRTHFENTLEYMFQYLQEKKFRKWIEDSIASKIAEITGKKIEYLTFKELREFQVKYRALKHLYIYGTRIGDNPKPVLFSSEDPNCDDYIISDIVRISMSIPFVFKPHCVHAKIGGRRTQLNKGFFVDGAMLYNLPVETFDQKRYQTHEDLKEEGKCPKFNKKTLAFRLAITSQEEPALEEVKTETVGELLRSLTKLYFSSENCLRQLNSYSKTRIIEIDTGTVTILSFDLNKEEKQALIASGRKSME